MEMKGMRGRKGGLVVCWDKKVRGEWVVGTSRELEVNEDGN